jgi:hypothetical protein
MLETAESFDLDGLIIANVLPFQFDSVLKHYRVRPVDYVPPPISPLPWIVDETDDMTSKERFNFGIQSGASIDPDSRQYIWNSDTDIFGNTGRPNKRPWVDMTKQTLDSGLVLPYFKDIFFRPENVESIQSKGAAILELTKRYKNVTHYDDDPWIVFGLAKIFPDVSFVLVQNLEFGILVSQREMNQFPNVARVARLQHFEKEHDAVISSGPVYKSYFELKVDGKENLDILKKDEELK